MRRLLLAFSLIGCGARSDLGELAFAGGSGPDASDAATPAVSDAMPDAPTLDVAPDVPEPRCRLEPGDLQVVVERPFDVGAGGVLGRNDGRDGTLLTWTSSNGPSPDPTWRVTTVDDLGRPTGSEVALVAHTGSYGSPSLAEGFGRRAAAVWDERGATFLPIAANGAPTGPATALGPRLVRGLRAQADGFTVFEEGPTSIRLVTLDAIGRTVARNEIIGPTENAFWYTRTWLPSGRWIVAWLRDRLTPNALSLRAFDPRGLPLEPARVLAPTSRSSATVASLESDGKALIAWFDGGRGGDRTLQLVRVDDRGVPDGPIFGVPEAVSRRRNELALARVRDDVLLAAWVDDREPNRWAVRLQQLDRRGLPDGPPMTIEGVRFALGVRLVRTALGALVVFSGTPLTDEDPRNRLFAAPLVCRP